MPAFICPTTILNSMSITNAMTKKYQDQICPIYLFEYFLKFFHDSNSFNVVTGR